MKEFNEFVNENKESFNKLNAKAGSWEKIRSKLDKPKVKKPNVLPFNFILKIASVLIIIVGIIGVYNSKIQTSIFSEIVLDSPEGITTPLDPSQNKFTLVQFWESGNVICSEDNCYYYLPAYEKYKDKGFEIYAISLDHDKEDWLNGIEENNLPWIHVSDLKGWKSPVCIECNISKVPTSILIDNKGKIIDKDLEADQLEQKLELLLASSD